MKVWLKGVLMNLQFFTAIPIPIQLPMDKKHLNGAIKTFPLLGMIQGVIYAFIFYLLLMISPFSPLTAAIILWVTFIVVTGGIHLDGWMDASDAYFSYGDRQKRLEVMKDPRVGAFGVLSVILLLSTKLFFIYEIAIKLESASVFFFIACIPFFSRMVMGMMLMKVKTAKNSGLGYMFQDAATSRSVVIYGVYILLVVIWLFFFFPSLLFGFTCMFIISLGLFIIMKRKSVSWFGGTTGDVIGACVEGVEWSLWMVLWLLHYFVMG